MSLQDQSPGPTAGNRKKYCGSGQRLPGCSVSGTGPGRHPQSHPDGVEAWVDG